MSSKQGLMAESPSLSSPTAKYIRPTASSLFYSQNPLLGYSTKGSSDSEAAMSPTSILETKPFSSSIRNPFFSHKAPKNPPSESKHHPWANGSPGAVGLGIIDALRGENPDNQSSIPDSRMVLFGSQLKIQIPSIHPNSVSPSPRIEFGLKNKNSLIPSPMGPTIVAPEVPPPSPGAFIGCLLAREMELSEDYTRVISHGPNPRTTHIFDNCVVESCGYGFGMLKENSLSADRTVYPSSGFLSFCYACRKSLGPGKDIFMYRGEKAFCSVECRYQEMLFDEGMEKSSSETL